jgi:hypothetical protein
MERAAGEAAGGQQDEDRAPFPQAALEALRWNWDSAYDIGFDREHGWTARRKDGRGALIEAGWPEELRREILADYMDMPVSRVGADSPEHLADEISDAIAGDQT